MRAATNRDARRAVLWADAVVWYQYAPDLWLYSHVTLSGRQVSASTWGYADTAALYGQYLGFSDGSVQWLSRSDMDLNLANKDSAATYKVGTWKRLVVLVSASIKTSRFEIIRCAEARHTLGQHPAIARAPNGDLLILYGDYTDQMEGQRGHLIRSRDQGRTWSDPNR